MSAGDSEHPISFLLEPDFRGGHVHVRVRAGTRGHRALSGTLTFRPQEWTVLAEILRANPEIDAEVAAMYRYAPEGARSWLDGVKLVWVDTVPIEIDQGTFAPPDDARYRALARDVGALAAAHHDAHHITGRQPWSDWRECDGQVCRAAAAALVAGARA